jgi:predicted metal-dependent HD superfamily phosphohydrolase
MAAGANAASAFWVENNARRSQAAPLRKGHMAASARWRGLQDLFEHVPLDDRAKEQLFDEMSKPDRLYHGVAHLELLWRRHKLYSGGVGLADPAIDRLVACAIAYHDAVHDHSRPDNEERSAEFWLRASAGSPVRDEDRQWVAQTIRATGDHLAYAPDAKAGAETRLRERARAWVLDLDLTPLGDPPDVFESNTRLLRAEAGQLSDEAWKASMLAFGRRFLAAPRIYRFPQIAAIYEASARRNLARLPLS